MPDLDTYLAERWAGLSEETIRILDLRNPEVALKTRLFWSLQWVTLKESTLINDKLNGVNYNP